MRLQVFLCLLLSSLCFCAALNMSSSLDNSGKMAIKIKCEFPGAEGREVNLTFSAPIDTVLVRDRSGLEINYSIYQKGNNTIISAIVPTDYLEYDLSSDSFTDKEGDLWAMDISLGSSENVSSFSGQMSFPQHTTIKSTNGAISQQGDSLAIIWQGTAVDVNHRVHLRAGYEIAETAQSDSLPLVAGALAFFIVIALALAYLFLSRKRAISEKASYERDSFKPKPLPEHIFTVQPPQEKPAQGGKLESNPIFKTLDGTDKEIIREISKQGGKTTQAHLLLNTHISKATLSRRIESLANREIIVKSQKGIRNLISLSESITK